MASVAYIPQYDTRETYLNTNYSAASWLLTRDHKRIAILYMFSITLFFAIGGSAAVIMRLQLLTPHSSLVEAETYNKLFTLHGIVMVFFFLVPSRQLWEIFWFPS
jgi:cytochrome c oxidase subunit 1